MGAGSLQLQMLPYPSTLLQKIFLRLFISVSAQWHSASAGREGHIQHHHHRHHHHHRLYSPSEVVSCTSVLSSIGFPHADRVGDFKCFSPYTWPKHHKQAYCLQPYLHYWFQQTANRIQLHEEIITSHDTLTHSVFWPNTFHFELQHWEIWHFWSFDFKHYWSSM